MQHPTHYLLPIFDSIHLLFVLLWTAVALAHGWSHDIGFEAYWCFLFSSEVIWSSEDDWLAENMFDPDSKDCFPGGWQLSLISLWVWTKAYYSLTWVRKLSAFQKSYFFLEWLPSSAIFTPEASPFRARFPPLWLTGTLFAGLLFFWSS